MAKHRQLACQVGESVSSIANSMAESRDANNMPKGTTFVFSSWACMVDGSGDFTGYLIAPKEPKTRVMPSSTVLASLDLAIEFTDKLAESATWCASCRCLAGKPAQGYP